MPFKSQSQRARMYATHPEMAKRWEKETPKGKLPKHVDEHGNKVRQLKKGCDCGR